MKTHNEVLQDRIKDLEQLVEALSKKLVIRDSELYDQIAKTVSVQTEYIELIAIVKKGLHDLDKEIK